MKYKTDQRIGQRSSVVTFVTTPEVKKALASVAAKEDRTLSRVIEKILKDYLGSAGLLSVKKTAR